MARHGIRWTTRYKARARRFEFTAWHATDDDLFTVCGKRVNQRGAHRWSDKPLLPEIGETIDCRRCQEVMAAEKRREGVGAK